MATGDPFVRLRQICLALPEAVEKPFGGHITPGFRVRDKFFATGAEGDGRPSVWCKAPPGAQDVLVGAEPERFFKPPYLGGNGWIGLWLDIPTDWDVVAGFVRDSYLMTAPKPLAKLLD